jgi:hypothetical protein
MKTSESLTPFDTPFIGASARPPFPLRTLMVCFTVWLIATEVLVFDQIRFNAKAELVEQAARALGGSHVIVPGEGIRDVPNRTKLEKL